MRNANHARTKKRQSQTLPTKQKQRQPVKQNPTLRFTPYAWAKLIYLRDAGPTEIGGFGISASHDPLLVKDFVLVKQKCDWASVVFDDEAVADYFDRQVDSGRQPEEFGRVWLHTHPGDCAQPSSTDELTFERVFGTSDWAVMFILARGGAHYCRLRFNVGPGAAVEIPVEVDYRNEFPATNTIAWDHEYQEAVGWQAGAVDQEQLLEDAWQTALADEDAWFDETNGVPFEEELDPWSDRWMLTPLGEEVASDAHF